jgi:uncharacterized protein (DUF934 family)
MHKLLDRKGAVLTSDPWQIITSDNTHPLPPGKLLLPLDLWLETKRNPEYTGIWFDSSEEPERVGTCLLSTGCIAINFPSFTDGRGFSLARIIRQHYGYQGQLRAFGDVLYDQLFFLARCGFDTFLLDDSRQPDQLQACIRPFTVSYQNCLDSAKPLTRARS